MRSPTQHTDREKQAWAEIGQTTIHPRTAIALALVFVATLFAVPIHQHWREWRQARSDTRPFTPVSLDLWRRLPAITEPVREAPTSLSAWWIVNRDLLQAINSHEDLLEDESLFGQAVRPAWQSVFSRWLGVGNEQAYIGHDGWLFYRPGIDSLTGPGFLDPRQLARRAAQGSEWQRAPQPDPRPAILDFHRQLQARDIALIVVPTPIKPSIHPEQFSARYATQTSSLQNVSFDAWLTDLEAQGITIFDPAPLLWERKDTTAPPTPQFLATDTHWRPEAMEAVARALAHFIQHRFGQEQQLTSTYQQRSIAHAAIGDIARMLDLPADQRLYPPEPVTLSQVITQDDQFWRADPQAEILVLGDSFSNIYSLEPMGWGEAAGWVEQLSFHLQAPIDRLVRNDDGAYATRAMLQRELARGHDRLDGKRIVIWQFAARELAVGDWPLLALDVGTSAPSDFLVLEPGTTAEVTGVVQAVSPVPRPGTVPYEDHIMALHLVDLNTDAEAAVVYVHSMRANEWTRAARLRPGDEISLRLRPWADVASRYDGLNRSELDDWELQLQEPNWGERISHY